jgi:hypothetical protein
MTRDEAKDFIRRAFKPLECGVEGLWKDDPIRFKVRTSDKTPVHRGEIRKPEWESEDLLRTRLENERDMVRQKGFDLAPL